MISLSQTKTGGPSTPYNLDTARLHVDPITRVRASMQETSPSREMATLLWATIVKKILFFPVSSLSPGADSSAPPFHISSLFLRPL